VSEKKDSPGISFMDFLAQMSGAADRLSPEEDLKKAYSTLDEMEAGLKSQKGRIDKMKAKSQKLREAMASQQESMQSANPADLQSTLVDIADLVLTMAEMDLKGYEENLERQEKKLEGKREQLKQLSQLMEEQKRRKKQEEEAEAELLKKAKFQPGDKVRVSMTPLKPDDDPGFTDEMGIFKGQVVTIKCVHASDETDYIYYHAEENQFAWAERWLEPVPEEKAETKKRKKLDH
jgi:hypothetical protein